MNAKLKGVQKKLQVPNISVQYREDMFTFFFNFGHILFEYIHDGLTWEKVLQMKK